MKPWHAGMRVITGKSCTQGCVRFPENLGTQGCVRFQENLGTQGCVRFQENLGTRDACGPRGVCIYARAHF
jgi:hypothetical protein